MTTRKRTKANLCKCGCGEEIAPGRTFRQGHDARYHGRVAKIKDGRLTLSAVLADVKAYARPHYQQATRRGRRRTN